MNQSKHPETDTLRWNDSLTGDFLWTNANFAEAIADVMTPCTWSMWQQYISQVVPIQLPDLPIAGNIGGRPYLNLSLSASLGRAFGVKARKVLQQGEGIFGRVPDDVEVPTVPISLGTILIRYLPVFFSIRKQISQYKIQVSAFLSTTSARCEGIRQCIQTTADRATLVTLWQDTLLPYLNHTFWVLRTATKQFSSPAEDLRRKLLDLIGEADTNALLSNLRGAGSLESIGPMIGLARIARGEMTRQTYLQRYGHRGPHEMELSLPRPSEDPDWLDQQLADFAQNPVDVDNLLEKQHAAFDAAWGRFESRYPRKAKRMRDRIAKVGAAAQVREAVRSDATRVIGVVRAFALRAGALTGLDADIFFLALDEIAMLLSGNDTATAHIPARRKTHERYSALPPYPAIIVGAFNPVAWAADPNRRSDVYDARTPTQPSRPVNVKGFAGAAGIVEGIARVIDAPEDGDQLLPGEILVTVKTNVGWTPLFPRAAAVVTDVGAPLSHAAIVARELGIPAVVGCGNATMMLHTGDRVRVDGGRGTVEILA